MNKSRVPNEKLYQIHTHAHTHTHTHTHAHTNHLHDSIIVYQIHFLVIVVIVLSSLINIDIFLKYFRHQN